MRNIFLLTILFFFTTSYSQNNNEWKEVYQYELDGKIESAQKEVQKIYRKAKRKKDDVQIIKCFFYISKYSQVFEEKAQTDIISNLKNEIKEANPTSKALLNYIYASILQKYYSSNSYQIKKRTPLVNDENTDFLTWSASDFEEEIKVALEYSTEDTKLLRETSIDTFKDVFEISPSTDAKNYSLYDFLSTNKITQYKQRIHNWESQNKSEDYDLFKNIHANTKTFLKYNVASLKDENIKKIALIFQENEKYYLSNKTEKVDLAYYERLKFAYWIYNDTTLFQKNIQNLEKNTTNESLKQQLRLERVDFYYNNNSKILKNNLYKEALALIDTIVHTKINTQVMFEAENIKHKILQKYLAVQLQKIIYPNQNNRAFVNFKNVDTIKISYYKLPIKYNFLFKYNPYFKDQNNKLINKDSLILDFKSNHLPIKSFTRKLPEKEDYFEYSTEILLEKLDIGNYLIFMETLNDSISNRAAYTFENIQVTNFFIVEDNEKKNDLFYVLDRKTGKPLENVKIKNEEETIYTNKEGKASFKLQKQDPKRKYSYNLLVSQNNDTITKEYNRNFIINEGNSDNFTEYERFEAKAMVYFDRAIYRPGQTLYYKGIIIQNKQNVKSVVPFVSVHVTINDANDNTINEFEVQTNEFGSFSGEFIIPKNTLTGEFYIEIDEAEDYEVDKKYYDEKEEEHKFWDNVDFENWEEFHFQVEEYKRPTFEVNFDEVKENYTIGDTLKIKGNAKALAGNNLTNAKVTYTVSKNISLTNKYIPYEKNFINEEIYTDENGNFEIEFPANHDNIKNDSVLLIDYTINIDIIDSNGETRSQSKNIKVGKNMLSLDILANNNLLIEEVNNLTVKSSTLNNFPLDTKGQIKIYQLEQKDYLKQRLFQFPEIQTISRSTFEVLFPHEPYDQKDNQVNDALIKTIEFDTKKGNEISLDFLKEFKIGKYNILVEAYDIKNNLISSEKEINLYSKNNSFSEKEIFTYKDISKQNSNKFEIEFQSVIPNLWITTRFYGEESEIDKEVMVQLINGKAIVSFNKKTNYSNTVNFHFSSIWENESAVKTYAIKKETTETALNIEVLSMRNKIEPGSVENWSFKILNKKIEAEILASMYDSSLDQFIEKNWSNIYFNNYSNYINQPNFNFQNLSYKNFQNFDLTIEFFTKHSSIPEINWFGFDFNNPKNSYILNNYINSLKLKMEVPKNAKTITGTVSDAIGPLAGANVVVQGTMNGATTNFDGEFNLPIVIGDILSITYTGMNTVLYPIKDRSQLNIFMEESLLKGGEVVVTGALGIKRESKMVTYAAQSTGITYSGSTLVNALSGKIAGVQVTNYSVAAGSSSRVVLRGNSSISANNQALFVIDGVVYENAKFNKEESNEISLNTNDIESITVLKGSEATALYGIKAANGVIIITTKNALKELVQVKTRTNFKETAFFYPHLKTDNNGNIAFQFTTPESLTKWKLRLFAHNKKAETGYFETKILSQKEVMIQTNMPRFVREKDTINISAKVVNMTNETKSGVAILMLYDATTMQLIDEISMNIDNVKKFNCKPKESTLVNWTVTIPENLHGLQYKIIAKSGNFSDGEESILPVLTNKILVTETIPIWVKGNTKKEYSFENLKNNNSKTLKNHLFTLEYTSNPVWFAIQSLPYLMEYEHECAEQTFSRYYANFIATELINSNPKIATLFDSWKKNPEATSKLTQNEELKSILLNETPWLLDTESNSSKNKNLALLMDLNTLKHATDNTLNKLKEKQLANGAFSWFDGGQENVYITQHIVSGLGHLNKLFPGKTEEFEKITQKAIIYLDANFVKSNSFKNNFTNEYSNLHYMYARSFYLDKTPISKKADSLINVQKGEFKDKWLQYSIYKKALLALTIHRFGDKKFAEKIITNLKETAARNKDIGMYWLENVNGNYWYQSAIETQTLLIEAFNEIEKDKTYVDEMKIWLLKQKQLKNWATTKATTEAIYALLLQGSNWTSIKNNTNFKINNEKTLTKKLAENDKETEVGYLKMNWTANEISKNLGEISIENKTEIPAYGGIYWQYFENLENIKPNESSTFSITKNLYKKIKTPDGNKLVVLSKETIKLGDLITIQLIIKTENDLDYIHLKDLRASCFEPVDVISTYQWKDNINYYMSTKDAATHMFFDKIKKGTYVLEYDVRINNSGSFNDGIATIQSMYAPEFSAYSKANKVVIKK
jgi:TonB-dependent SusC/RagA subfamily outer membrane receptor